MKKFNVLQNRISKDLVETCEDSDVREFGSYHDAIKFVFQDLGSLENGSGVSVYEELNDAETFGKFVCSLAKQNDLIIYSSLYNDKVFKIGENTKMSEDEINLLADQVRVKMNVDFETSELVEQLELSVSKLHDEYLTQSSITFKSANIIVSVEENWDDDDTSFYEIISATVA